MGADQPDLRVLREWSKKKGENLPVLVRKRTKCKKAQRLWAFLFT